MGFKLLLNNLDLNGTCKKVRDFSDFTMCFAHINVINYLL